MLKLINYVNNKNSKNSLKKNIKSLCSCIKKIFSRHSCSFALLFSPFLPLSSSCPTICHHLLEINTRKVVGRMDNIIQYIEKYLYN